MLDHPDFSDIATMRSVLRAFEDKARLIDLLSRMAEERGVQVMIGSENPDGGHARVQPHHLHLHLPGPGRWACSAWSGPGAWPTRTSCPSWTRPRASSPSSLSRVQPAAVPAVAELRPPQIAGSRLLYFLHLPMSDRHPDLDRRALATNEPAEEIRRLREALEAKTREVEEHQQDRYLRAVAEFDNARKRAAREREEYTRYANESLLREHPARPGQFRPGTAGGRGPSRRPPPSRPASS